MATHTAPRLETPVTEADGLLSKAALQLRQFMCGLHGHDSLMHFEQGRISLLCASCGHETPGWDIQETPARHQNQASSARIVTIPMVHHRRVA